VLGRDRTFECMTDDALAALPRGPILLCAGTDPAAAARLAEAAVALLADRTAAVLATWQPPPVVGGYDAVMDALYDSHAELRAAARHAAAEAAGAACEVLDAHGLDVTRRVCPDEQAPWRVILDIADELDAAVIVAGISERADARPGALGREARALAHRARRPLLLVPAGSAPAGERAPALVAYDGSASAAHAVSAAVELLRPRPTIVASAWQTASYAVGVALLAVPDEIARKGADGLDESSRREAEGRANAGLELLAAAGWPCRTETLQTSRGAATAVIAAADEHDAAVVVTGTRGRSRIAAALLGSTAEGILRHAGRPALLVPPTAED
jgi:nucleotide-binding universal stress UspA family protein